MAPGIFPAPPSPSATGGARRIRYVAVAVAATAAAIVAPLVTAPGAAAAKTVELTAPPIERSLPMKATAVRVAVKNVGKKRLTGLTLSVGSAKRVRVRVTGAKKGRTSRSLKALKAGATTRVTVRLQRTKGGPKQGAVTVRVKRKGKTLGSERLRFGPPKLTGRYFWGSTYTLNGIDQKTLYFANDGLVFTGDMEGAWATCAAADEKCRSYQYDGDRRQLVIDGKAAELEGRRIKYDGQTYFEFAAPAAGTRWAGTLTYSNSSGLCPLYCTYFTEHLQFATDGRFVRRSVVSGSSPVVDWASVPPEDRGTYEVRAGGMFLLAYADGKQRLETVGVYVADDGTLESPMKGMILDGDGYFDISKD